MCMWWLVRKELCFRVWLLCFSICSIFILYCTSTGSIKNFWLNLGTAGIGILVTVVLIENALHQSEKREQEKMKKIALQQLRFPLKHHLEFFQSMLKASIDDVPNKEYIKHTDLFDDFFYEEIVLLDLKGTETNWVWAGDINRELGRFVNITENMLSRYLPYLGSELVELLVKIADTSLIPYTKPFEIATASGDKSVVYSASLLWTNIMKDFREYVHNFSTLIDLYNSHFPEDMILLIPDYLEDENMLPLIGSGRMWENEG